MGLFSKKPVVIPVIEPELEPEPELEMLDAAFVEQLLGAGPQAPSGLAAGAVFTYGAGWPNTDGSVTLNLTCGQPGGGLPGAYVMILSTANVSTIQSAGTQTQQKAALDAIVQAYMVATYRPSTAIQASLNALVGLTVTVA